MDNQVGEENETKFVARPLLAVMVLLGGTIILILVLIGSISIGAVDIRFQTVIDAIFHNDLDVKQHHIIMELRLPRALAGAMVGGCFAVAGAIMQGMTRNPLSSPGLMGINSGSAFALAMIFAFFPGLSYQYVILFSFAGAAGAVWIIYSIVSMNRAGISPARLVLVGAALSALLSSLSAGIAVYYHISQDITFWYAGGLAGIKWVHIKWIAPWVMVGIVGALLISRSITILNLGEEMATGLGQKTKRVQLFGAVIVLILAGSSVAAVGPIGFVGLVIPHIARFLVGVDYRWVIPCSALLGGLLLVLADLCARMINAPYETPVGAITAIIGVPFFLYLARKEWREE